MKLLNYRDWTVVSKQFEAAAPYRHVILDDFLSKDIVDLLREQLINHWGWRRKNWVSEHLHNAMPKNNLINNLIDELNQELLPIIGELNYSNHWALMYLKNTKGNIHTDNASLTITIWLTSDEYNMDANTGGLLIYDVSRPHDERISIDYIPENVGNYIKEKTKGNIFHIPYRMNRAVILDAALFHCTDSPNFDCTTPNGYRINFSIAYD